MRITVQRCLINSVPSVVISTSCWSTLELGAMIRLGEPVVDIGGVFYKNPCGVGSNDECGCPDDSNDSNDVCETDECFSLPSSMKGVKSGFPVMVQFDSGKFMEPEVCAKAWADEIARRIAVEVKNLRYNGAMFVKEEVYEV